MGNFLSILKQAGDPVELSYLDSPSMKLREYYASFKLICDNFSIDTTEYSQIFGSNVSEFAIWDGQKTGRIDALELFSGLVLFSSADFELKLQFLFEIFDLNEQGALSFENLQFMIINCCSAAFKIYQINAMISDEEVEVFLSNYFYSESSVKLKTLLKWTAREQNIREFFKLIRKDVPELRKRQYTRPTDLSLFESQRKPFSKPLCQPTPFTLPNDYGNYVKKLQQLQLPISKPTCSSFNPKIKWVYGIRTEDIAEPVRCITNCGDKAANQKLLYFVGKTVVIYYPKLSSQQHYTEHQQEISCLVISKNSLLAASGELSTKPNIHIWDVKTLSTVLILRNHHRTPISQLLFLKSDKLLISSSFHNNQTSVLVHSLQDQTVLFSYYLTDTIVSLLPLLTSSGTQTSNMSITNSQNSSLSGSVQVQDASFIIVCSLSAYYFVYHKQTFTKHFFNLDMGQQEVTAGIISLRGDCLMALTGHPSGRVMKWMKFQFPELLIDIKKRVIGFTHLDKDIYVLSESQIFQVNTFTFQCIRKIVPPPELYIGELTQLIPVGSKKAIALSLMGDMVQISNLNPPTGQPAFKKLTQVLKTQSIRASCISDRQLYLANSYLVMRIDLAENQLSGVYTFFKEKKEGKEIVCMAVYGNRIALGLADGELIVITQGNSKLDQKQQSYILNSPPIDLIITKTHLLVLTSSTLQLFSVSADKYFTKVHEQRQPKRMLIKQPTNTPLGLITTSNQKLNLISCQSGFLKTEFDLSYSPVTFDDVIPAETLSGKIQPSLYPFVYSPKLNFRLTADKNSVLFWNTYRSTGDSGISKANRCFHKLQSHAARISNLLCYQEDGVGHFLSVGSLDQMVVMWENSTQGEVDQQNLDSLQLEDVLVKELSEQNSKLEELNKDSQIRIKNTMDKGLDKVIQQILVPDNPNEYEVQIDKTIGQQQLFMPPPTSLKLNYVFGFSSACTRKSLHYCHIYPQGKKKVIRHQSKVKTVKQHLKVSTEIMNQVEYCKQFLLPYTQSHTDCRKYCVYFTDRICVRFDPQTKQQRFYDSHRNSISCIAVHPRKRIVCSAQAPTSYMGEGWLVCLHFWDSKSLQTIHTFTINKCSTVRVIQFSRDGKYLVSLSSDAYFSYIHVIDWQNDNLIAYRCLGTDVVFDVKFNPYKKTELAVCGVNTLRIYQVSCGTLVLGETAIHTKAEVITCLAYISNSYGTVIESDILTGNNHGDIGLFICGKYMTVKEKAHNAMVNYLKVCQLFKYKTILVSAGEDQCVRIWDTKMELVNQINLRNLACMSCVHPGLNCSAQSIDIFHCDTESHNGNESHTILLIGTRNGDILEAAIKNQYKGLKLYVDKKGTTPIKQQPQDSSQDYKEREVIHFKYSVQLRSYPSSSPVKMVIHRDKMITLNKTQQFLLWDLTTKQITQSFKTNGSPSTATFSNTGDILAVGYNSGEIDFYDVNEWNLHPFQRIVNGNYQVLSIVFSDSDSKLAVSLVPIKLSRQKIPMVSVFNSKSQPRKNTSAVERISKLTNIYNQSVSNNSAAYFMNFSANQNEDYLLLWYQLIPSEMSTQDRQGKFFLWDLERNDVRKTLEGIQFNSINFSSAVNIKYSIEQDEETENQYVDQYDKSDFVTDMSQANSTLIMGTTNGQLVLSRSSCFYSQPQQTTSSWALGRCYFGHAGQISSVQVVNNELYTSGSTSSAVMKWTIVQQQISIDKSPQTKQVYEEVLNKARLDTLALHIFPNRKNIFEVYENQDTQTKSTVDLKLRNVIGRNSLFKRNNLLCDFNNNIIMHAGCNLVMFRRQQGSIKQQFLKVDTSEFSTLPEISVVCLSDDRRVLVVGTCSQTAKVIVWDINSRTCLSQAKFKDIIQIRCLRISRNNNNIIATCLTNQNVLRLVFASLNVQKKRFSAFLNFDYSANTTILDLAFIPGEQSSFVSCGTQHMVQWRANCGLLTYENYKTQGELINIYCLAFVKENLVSGSEDGYLYIWENKRIVKRQEAHPKEAILALYCSQDSRIFASGGTDGKVILWQLTSNILQKLYQYSVYEGPILSNTTPTKHHIQSICISSTKLIAGTRSGDIFEFDRPIEAESSQLQHKPPQLMLPSFNHEQVISLRFSPSSKNLYVLTKAGTLSIIELDTLKKKFQYQIDMYEKELLKMFVCQVTEIILLVFVDQIQVFDSFQRKEEHQRLASCRFNRISDAVLSSNQKMLAVLLAANQAENAKLQVYNLNIRTNRDRRMTITEQSQTFTLYYTQENLPTNIDFIDFSTDNEYLVYKPREDSENVVIKLLSKERANTFATQFHIEWAGQGKRTLDAIKAINSFYSQDNQLLSLAQITDKCVIASDQMGSLRIFTYPVVQQQTYSKCFFEHLNNVSICLASPDCRKLVTYSKVDRNINVWDVIFCPE